MRRGRGSPHMGPVVYPRARPPARPYYDHPSGSGYLFPNVGGDGLHRSRSTGHRQSPPPAPVVINNRIYNDIDDEEHDRGFLQLAPTHSHRSRSRSHSRVSSGHSSRDSMDRRLREEYEIERARDKARREYELEMAHTRKEYELEKSKTKKDIELEKTRKELEAFKLEAEREAEEKRLKKEMELTRLKEEKRKAEEKKRAEKEAEEAVEKFKKKEAERAAKEKKEKEEMDKEYERRLEEDLRKGGLDERQIAVITKKEKAIDPNRPTYTRMSRRHLSIETLNKYRIDYTFDQVRRDPRRPLTSANTRQDPDYILIKRWVPEYEQDFLWSHTKEIRERRRPMLIGIEERKHHHSEPEFEFVRKKEHKRKPSPSPLLTFLAGGKR
jgi:hypothetical protein